MSLLHAAKLKEALSYADDSVVSAYMAANAECPTRAEALHGAARFCRKKGLYERGYECAVKGLAIPYPNDALFVEDWIYEYGLLDELAINAYWTTRYAECVDTCDRLLNEGKIPAGMRARVLKNRDLAVGKLAEATASSPAEAESFTTLLRDAREKEALGRPSDEVISAYTMATSVCPTRAEALHGAARFCRDKGIHEQGYRFAAEGLTIAYPGSATTIEDWIYEYGLLDELAINAYWSERYAECVDACHRLLSEGKLPAGMRDRVLRNKDFAVSKLDEAAAAPQDVQLFVKLLRAARHKESLAHPREEVLSAYAEATAACPTRAEALHGASRFCRNKGLHELGYQFAAQGVAIAYPIDAALAEHWIYEYGLLDELAVNAYWTGRYEECVDTCDRLLSEGKLPITERNRVLKNRQFAIDKIAESTASTFGVSNVATLDSPPPEIPRIFHFITGLDSNFGGKPFSLIHYMAIRSALQVNRGFRAKVYYHFEPSGKYWDAIKGDAELVRVDLPTEVFGNPVKHFAHKADVLRMRILLEQGGIYLDLDTICQRPFEPLLDGRVVMGREEKLREDGSLETVGLCNATIIAPPNAEFLRLWYEAYRDFTGGTSGDGWNKFSVKIPLMLARQHPNLLHIEPAASFFWPSWDKEGIASMFSKDCEFPQAYCFHLWEAESWNLAKHLDFHAVATIDTTYNKVARRFIEAEEIHVKIRDRFSRIYDANVWGPGSGVGSLPEHTLGYRGVLQQFILCNNVRSVVDFGCGDWQFSRHIDWSGVTYVGVDIVASVIETNQHEFGRKDITFQEFESLSKLPVADLVVCKDVLQHLPNQTVKSYLAAFKKKYKFLLITNDEEPTHLQNIDIDVGGWRTLRLDLEPFREPGAIVFSWTVPWGEATTRKSTYLLVGNPGI